MSEPRPAKSRRLIGLVLGVLVVVAVVAAAVWAIGRWRDTSLANQLLSTDTTQIPKRKDLLAYAEHAGKPLFAQHCAACHGADMKGLPAIGAPNLTDANWLYGYGNVYDIERTILYGIRSDTKKTRNITEMPAFGLRGQLSATDINNVVQYVYQLSGQPHDSQAAELGKAVYAGNASCGDCHSYDGSGNGDYGAPSLTINVWNYGGDPRSLYNSIYFGRHGTMPAWYGKLTLAQIRTLAVYVYAVSHR